ncbi:hypothetical protein, partial [Streptomyces sp. NPDC059468]|uniref:hypothetical protein n=1 Tax=Streptomyces sp. NPDC059468 TaxID=3346845 RepID=UPI003698A2A9
MQDVVVTEPAGQELQYTALVEDLARLLEGPLKGSPSDRALAHAAQVSPTTVGNWLRKGQFPQKIDPLLRLVYAVQRRAKDAGLAGNPAVAALLDRDRWKRAHEAEALRRADGIRGAVEAWQGRAVLERTRPGWPLAQMSDPFRLEVHRVIASTISGLPVLPEYVEREHDRTLAEVVAQAAAGESRIAVLVGASSTGKTRTLWESLRQLRDRPEPWRLWHPIDPTRPDALLADLANLAPHTVVWLNEAQEYLDHDQLGEQAAAGLRTLLHDPSRAPVLVLATLWPDHWNTLTTRASPDRHAQARELLDGHRIGLPDAFTGADLAALTSTAGHDPRLGEAAEHARDGQITQYLAGGPVLLDRYHNAPPATRALIHAAMDARRLGAGPHIPWAWLAQAAPGYFTDTERDTADDDWLEQARSYLTTSWNNIPGILTRFKTTTASNQRPTSPDAGPTGHRTPQQGPLYRLADYLEQHGRHHRAETIPPITFWTAAARHAHPADLNALGNAAHRRGLYRDAAQLHKHATPHNTHAATALVQSLHALHPTDCRPAQWAADHAPPSDSYALARLLDSLQKAGAEEQTAALLGRFAACVSLDNPDAVVDLLTRLRGVGADEWTAALLDRNPAARVSLDNPDAVARLLNRLRWVGADKQAAALLGRAVARVSLDAPYAVARLLEWLREAGADEQTAALLDRNPAALVPLDNPDAVVHLLDRLRWVGADEQAAALLERAAADVSLDNPN